MSMSSFGHTRSFLAVLLVCCTALAFLWALQTFVPSFRQAAELAPCRHIEDENTQVECIFRAIEKELGEHSVDSAMQIFATAYDEFPAFLQVGCHRQAHRVGDLMYFKRYLVNPDLDAIDMPQSTTACGYGLYHGFMEHLIQDHPDANFVTETCEYLQDRLGGKMRDIRTICYHGSGHGFELAESERVPRRLRGNVEAFTTRPLAECERLPKATIAEKEQCKEGIFNVLVDWMELGDHGFTLDKTNLFGVCDGVPTASQMACYYEMAQKLDGAGERDPQKIVGIVSRIKNEEFRYMSFRVGIAGIIQNVIGQPEGYQKTLEQCIELPEEYYRRCLESIVHGLFEHGEPQREYVKALDVCRSQSLREKGSEEFCYTKVAGRLPRFYTDTQIGKICTEFPEPYRQLCIAQIGKHEVGM